jgi:hypothetical protein
VSNVDYRPDLVEGRQLLDNKESFDSQAPSRFFLKRLRDETGISATGRVGEGVLWQNGQVTFQWRPPMSTITVYKDFETFLGVHVRCHPSCNKVVVFDEINEDLIVEDPDVEYRTAVYRSKK